MGFFDKFRKVKNEIKKESKEEITSNCDICGKPISKPNGYLVTTTQVVSEPRYWRHYFEFHKKEFQSLKIFSFEDFVNNYEERKSLEVLLAGQWTPWLVCEDCIKLFSLDYEQTRNWARYWWTSEPKFRPPGTGPAPLTTINMGVPIREKAKVDSIQDMPQTSQAMAPSIKTKPIEIILSEHEQEMLKTYGSDPAVLSTKALEFRNAGRLEDSFACCRISAKLKPELSIAWVTCGITLFDMDARYWGGSIGPQCDNISKAVPYLDRALEMDKDKHIAWYYKAQCLSVIGIIKRDKHSFREGLKCFEQALRTRPDDAKTKNDKEGYEKIYRDTFGDDA